MPKLKKDKQYTIRFDDDEVACLNELAKLLDRDVSWLVRHGIGVLHSTHFPKNSHKIK